MLGLTLDGLIALITACERLAAHEKAMADLLDVISKETEEIKETRRAEHMQWHAQAKEMAAAMLTQARNPMVISAGITIGDMLRKVETSMRANTP
jgi:hypothetical protein